MAFTGHGKRGDGYYLATITPYLIGALVVAVLIDYAYGYYKHGVVTLFAFLLAFAYGLEGPYGNGGPWRKLIPALVEGSSYA